MFIIGGQSLFDYDIDSDESIEQGIKSKVQNIAFTMSLVERIGLLNTSILQVLISYENVLQVNNSLATTLA